MTTKVIDLKKRAFKDDLLDVLEKYKIGEFVVIAENELTHEVHIRSKGGTDLIALLEITKQQFIAEILEKRKEAVI